MIPPVRRAKRGMTRGTTTTLNRLRASKKDSHARTRSLTSADTSHTEQRQVRAQIHVIPLYAYAPCFCPSLKRCGKSQLVTSSSEFFFTNHLLQPNSFDIIVNKESVRSTIISNLIQKSNLKEDLPLGVLGFWGFGV